MRRESDLFQPVRAWLEASGHAVHVELFDADVVGDRSGVLTVVELKLGSPIHLLHQLHVRAMWADWVFGAMPHKPKMLGGFKFFGFGLLVVEGGKVRQVLKPKPQPWHWHKRHAYRVKKLSGRAAAAPHHLAGLPACPQLKAQRLEAR